MSNGLFTDEGYTSNIDFNDSSLTANETGTGGLFGSGISFGRWFTMVFFGIGLPSSTPSWFAVIFAIWQSVLTIFGIGWIVSSIWNG